MLVRTGRGWLRVGGHQNFSTGLTDMSVLPTARASPAQGSGQYNPTAQTQPGGDRAGGEGAQSHC